MKNYVQPGATLTLTAPYALTSGDGLLVGSIFGVAAGDAASGATVEAALTGVFDLTKIGSQAWTVGAKVYWTTPTSAAPRSQPTTPSSASPSRRSLAARATPSAGCA
ncbi:MAG: DUF2190 family protein [Rhodobacteraceae bacterium]|nr:DUF2190 family protein [Paracoccaceae bacterium]